MGVFLNRTFDDGSTVALWRITESEGKSLSEQRFAVDALIDNVFKRKYRLCHDSDGVPALEVVPGSKVGRQVANGSKAGRRSAAASRASKKGEPSAPFVSVSHTKGWAAVMTHPKEHVGIDIELSDRNFSAVEKKSLCPAELARLDGWTKILRDSLPQGRDADPSGTAPKENSSKTTPALNPRNTVLGMLWCAKEAVYKRLTVPATDFENQIEIESITPVSPIKPNGNTKRLCEPTTEGKITAIFKHGNGDTTRIRLEYYIISSLLLVHTK